MENFNSTVKIGRKREKAFLDRFLSMFELFNNYANLLLGVFLKRNMGRRHFSVTAVVKLTVVLFFIPILLSEIYKLYLKYRYGFAYPPNPNAFWITYGSWYLFLGCFLAESFNRWRETRKKPLWSLEEQSFYEGESKLKSLLEDVFNKPISLNKVECLCEPLLFFIIALALKWLDQERLGTLLFWASIFYCFDQTLAYRKGRKTVTDETDKWQGQQAIQNTILGNPTPTDSSRQYHTEKPEIGLPLKPTPPNTVQSQDDDPMVAN